MTQFTSFVAVEEMVVTDGGQPRRIDVPVEVPEGVNQAMVDSEDDAIFIGGLPKMARRGGSVGGSGVGRGSGNGIGLVATRTMSGTVSSNASITPQSTPAPVQTAQTYGFVVKDEAVTLVRVKTPEEKRLDELRLKLNPNLVNIVVRLRNKNSTPGPDESRFVRDGKAEVQLWLTEKTAEALAKLKELGFEVILDQKTSKLLIGRVSIEKLEALADLSFVRYVSPQSIN